LEAFLLDRRLALQDVAISGAMALMPTASPVPLMPMYRGRRRNPKPAPQEEAARPPRHARVLTPYTPYLIRRWRESGAESRQLWREIQALGCTHSARTVRRFITRLRRASDGGYAPEVHASPYRVSCPARAKFYSKKACGRLQSHKRSHVTFLTTIVPWKTR
jgi:hypothetical protein